MVGEDTKFAICRICEKSIARKQTPIWDHFVVGEDTKLAICRICEKSIWRHQNLQHYELSSSSKMKHSEQYVEYEKASEKVEQDKGKGKAVPRRSR